MSTETAPPTLQAAVGSTKRFALTLALALVTYLSFQSGFMDATVVFALFTVASLALTVQKFRSERRNLQYRQL